MRLLVDTHAFVWWAGAPERLTERARSALRDGTNTVMLSAVLW